MTRKRKNQNWKRPQCDNCGRFVGKKDIADGTARHDPLPPDSDFPGRTTVTLCKHCNTPTHVSRDDGSDGHDNYDTEDNISWGLTNG